MKFDAPFFAGGLYGVDFCNTFDHRHDPPEYDFLPDRDALLEWGRARGTLPKRVRPAPSPAGSSMARVRAARLLIFRLLLPFARSSTPSKSDISAFNSLFQETFTKLKLAPAGEGFVLACQTDDPVEQILCEAVRSVADLLLSNRQDRIRECRGCGWLFFDATRNGSRRWCTMAICGNRAKAHRHYQRVRRAKIISAGRGLSARR
jgi:predicted RNA-binding Zn ribbon-like protein